MRNFFKDFKEVITYNYSLLLLGSLTSKMGSIIYNIVLAVWVTQETNSARYFGYITAAGAVPVVLFNLFSGVIVDRSNRKLLLIIADLFSGTACLLIGFLAFTANVHLPLLILGSFIMGASSALFGPAAKAIIPEIIKTEHIKKSNSIKSTLSSVLSVCAPLLAGLLLDNLAWGIAGAFLINGISYYVSAVSEMFLRYNYIPKEGNNTYVQDLKQGFTYMKDHVWLVYLLLGCACTNIFLAAFNVVLPLFVLIMYPNNPSVYSTTLAYAALGGILAGLSLTLSKNKNTTFKQMGMHTILQGIAFSFIQITASPFILYTAVVFFIFFLTRFNIMFFSFVQVNVEKDMLGRVFSFIIMIALATTPFANLIFGYLSDYTINYLYIASGIGICLSSVLQFRAGTVYKFEPDEKKLEQVG